jgi:hypothetical protein
MRVELAPTSIPVTGLVCGTVLLLAGLTAGKELATLSLCVWLLTEKQRR